MPQPRPDMHEGPPPPERTLLQEVLERNLVDLEREHSRALAASAADTARLVAALDALRAEVERLRATIVAAGAVTDPGPRAGRPWWGRR